MHLDYYCPRREIMLPFRFENCCLCCCCCCCFNVERKEDFYYTTSHKREAEVKLELVQIMWRDILNTNKTWKPLPFPFSGSQLHHWPKHCCHLQNSSEFCTTQNEYFSTVVVITDKPLSHVWLCDPMDCSMPGFTVLHHLPELAQTDSIESVMPSNHLILCCPLLLLPSIFPSIRVFSNELTLHNRWPKYRSFSFSISPSNEYSGLTSFKIDWFDLFAVQGTLKNLLQHHSSKASILQHSAFFMAQLTTVHDFWKNHSFDYMDFYR